MKPIFQKLHKAVHGGRTLPSGNPDDQKKGEYLDFSASLNPYPPHLDYPISDEMISRYPDDDYITLKEVIARHHRCRPEEICVGNGSAEVIRTLCHTIIKPGTPVFIPPHTFSEYALSARLAGGEVTHSHGAQPYLSFFCNPDSPSGTLTPRDEILLKLESIANSEGILCVDEAFIDLADPAESVADTIHPNLFVLKSLTKSFSMAGVRFGYGIGSPDLIEAMEVMRPPWSVNAFAQAMAIAAFEKYPELELSRQCISRERERISRVCSDLGLVPSPASANYMLLDTGASGSDLAARMKNEGIIIRDCSSFGLPACVRVAVRTSEENDKLLEAFETCLRS